MSLERELIDAVGSPHVEVLDRDDRPDPGQPGPAAREPDTGRNARAPAQAPPPAAPHRWRVTPGSAAEVAEVIRRARAHKAAVHPIGAGGRPTRVADDRPRVYIATRRLDQVIQLDETSLLVHAQAGLTGLDLERILAPRNLSIGDYPPVVLTSSLGGILAVRTPGKSSARHGFFEDAVVGVSAVLADGRTVHTRIAPRRSTGPDLARVLCGSEGTIGFITSAVLRIHLRPESRLVAAYLLPSIDAAINAVYLALREEAAPSGIRIYDAREAAVHYPGLALPAGHALLCAGTAGPTDLATCDRDLLTSAVIAEGGTATDTALAELWWRRLHAGEPTPGPQPTLQVMATPSRLRAVYHAIARELPALGGTLRAHISRFDADGAVMFLTPERTGTGTGNDSAAAEAIAAAAEIVAAAERAAQAACGWLLGARAQELDTYLRALRDALDPDRIMNPGALA
ncbi:MAG TPA: FAD-binding oxidoreductase [Kofleriaceae bacterium]|jgi:FAD/FMN-containing dehydrogenase|nr:FAD-binding oxidoreductase [Kofleriaceae bacterium]